MIQVNAMGDTCPIPVVKTKNAIKELGEAGGVVETLVDNEISVQNLTKMANQKGYGVKSEKLGENQFKRGRGADRGERAHGVHRPQRAGEERRGGRLLRRHGPRL